MTKRLSFTALLYCFLRTYLIGAIFNPKGMQSLGMLYAMEPGIKEIYPSEQQRFEARKRYLQHFNSHPYWIPMLVGIFLYLEQTMADNRFPVKGLDTVKNTASYTFSAIGDSFFSGTILPFWALSVCVCLVAGLFNIGLWLTILFFLLIQVFRLSLFIIGLRKGLSIIVWLKKVDIIEWGERFKIVNATLLAVFLYLLMPLHSFNAWLLEFTYLWLAVLFIGKYHVPRFLLLLIALCIVWKNYTVIL